MIDHRMTGGGARVGLRQRGVGEEIAGEIERELHARRRARERLVVGDLPEPRRVAAAQRDRRRDRMSVVNEPVDARIALGGERGDGLAHERFGRRMRARRAAGAAFPAGGFERHEVGERDGGGRAARRHVHERARILEPAALAAQLLELLVRDVIEIAFALARRQQRARVLSEIRRSPATPRQHARQRRRERPVARDQRQHHQLRQAARSAAT